VTTGAYPDSDFPAESFFDVYVTIDIPSIPVSGLYNDVPIRIEASGVKSMPPWGQAYQMPDGMRVDLLDATGLPSGYTIVGVIHIPPPPEWKVILCRCSDPVEEPEVEWDPAMDDAWCGGGCPVPKVLTMHTLYKPDGSIEYTCTCNCVCGDLDGDGGTVDLGDFSRFQVCFGLRAPTEQCPPALFDCADLDQNGWINLTDFNTFQVLFGGMDTNTPPNCGS
jgi:hypothetical protein